MFPPIASPDRVDAAARASTGIRMCATPGYPTDEVADHAVTLLLAAWRHLIAPGNHETASAGSD